MSTDEISGHFISSQSRKRKSGVFPSSHKIIIFLLINTYTFTCKCIYLQDLRNEVFVIPPYVQQLENKKNRIHSLNKIREDVLTDMAMITNMVALSALFHYLVAKPTNVCILFSSIVGNSRAVQKKTWLITCWPVFQLLQNSKLI